VTAPVAVAVAVATPDAIAESPRGHLPDGTDAFEGQPPPAGPSTAVADTPTPPSSGNPSTDAFQRDPEPSPPRERDWEIDTMTAAELAALVARADREEPAELASIQIAIDEASEITVMPSESPRILAAAPHDALPAGLPAMAEDELARSLPRLAAVPADDPQIERAWAAVARSRDSSLRWLELEPAQPAPGSLAASLGAAAEADFGARTGVGLDRPAPGPAVEPPFDLGIPLGPDDRQEPARGTYAAALDGPPPAPLPDPALELAASGTASRITAAPRWMRAATVVLGLGLAAQLAHLYREELVGVAALQGPLTSLYAALGRPVAPRWDIGRYEVRQQGVVAEPVAAGTLTVRASIRNGAGRAQPAPLLRVILQDRFGNRIATRDLTPREYGGAAAIAPPPMLAPGQRIDAEVSLLDPGGEAVGFELDVCLRRADSSVSCANDAAAVLG
jgi:hypothetical protein